VTSGHRIIPGLIADIVDALERHGYCRGDDLHADRAIGLVGDPACIYEGTQDHPATAYPRTVPQSPSAYPGSSSHDALAFDQMADHMLQAALVASASQPGPDRWPQPAAGREAGQ